jgi:trk system potassium uptake protein TrkH
LHFTERADLYPHMFLDILFEVCSAAGTVGVTTGLTPFLSDAGKLIIIGCMFLGRLGPVTVVFALNYQLQSAADKVKYPDEKVIIG